MAQPKKTATAKKAAKSKKKAKAKRSRSSPGATSQSNPWFTKYFTDNGGPGTIEEKQDKVVAFFDWLLDFYNHRPGRSKKQYTRDGDAQWTPPTGGKGYKLEINLKPVPKHGNGGGGSDPPNPTSPPPQLG